MVDVIVIISIFDNHRNINYRPFLLFGIFYINMFIGQGELGINEDSEASRIDVYLMWEFFF